MVFWHVKEKKGEKLWKESSGFWIKGGRRDAKGEEHASGYLSLKGTMFGDTSAYRIAPLQKILTGEKAHGFNRGMRARFCF